MILGFGSKARHGKDTAAEAIIQHYFNQSELKRKHGIAFGQIQVKKVNFADALKKEVNDAIKLAGGIEKLLSPGIIKIQTDIYGGTGLINPGWVQPDPNPKMDDLMCPLGKHPKLLQWWGTEYRRKQDPDYWVKKWLEEVNSFSGILICSDVRHINEAEAIKRLGGYTVKVERVNSDGTTYYAPDRPSDHSSETELDNYNWDFYLKAVTGNSVLLSEEAITLAEYLSSFKNKKEKYL